MRFLISTLFGLHAVAHLVGFVWPWWMIEPVPNGAPDAGTQVFADTVMRSLGVLWFATGIAFWIASFAHFTRARWWRALVNGAAVASLTLSIVCAPGSLPGVPINLAIIALLRLTDPQRIARAGGMRVVRSPTRGRSFPARRLLALLYHPIQVSERRLT